MTTISRIALVISKQPYPRITCNHYNTCNKKCLSHNHFLSLTAVDHSSERQCARKLYEHQFLSAKVIVSVDKPDFQVGNCPLDVVHEKCRFMNEQFPMLGYVISLLAYRLETGVLRCLQCKKLVCRLCKPRHVYRLTQPNAPELMDNADVQQQTYN